MKSEGTFEMDGVDLSPYLRNVSMSPETTTVRFTPYRYRGWRRWWRRLTRRSVESPTYEFEATLSPSEPYLPGYREATNDVYDVTGFSYSVKPVGPIRRVEG